MVYKKKLVSTIYLLLCVVGVVFSQGTPEQIPANETDGYKKFYFPNGKLSSEGMIRSGKPDGYWKSYNENGLVKSEGNRLNFKLDSLWSFYNDSGIVVALYSML